MDKLGHSAGSANEERGGKMSNYKVKKGIFYFPTWKEAWKHASANGYPTDRIIEYKIGWAIQLRVSGAYVGLEK